MIRCLSLGTRTSATTRGWSLARPITPPSMAAYDVNLIRSDPKIQSTGIRSGGEQAPPVLPPFAAFSFVPAVTGQKNASRSLKSPVKNTGQPDLARVLASAISRPVAIRR